MPATQICIASLVPQNFNRNMLTVNIEHKLLPTYSNKIHNYTMKFGNLLSVKKKNDLKRSRAYDLNTKEPFMLRHSLKKCPQGVGPKSS
jgi:hypothetical protein